MKEWTNPFNPFNSMKILMYKKHLEACAKGEFLVPFMVDIDLFPNCNMDCLWCNGFDVIKENNRALSTEHFLKLVDYLKDWGIESLCLSGGGESLLHPGFNKILKKLYDANLKIGVITNGSLLTDDKIEILAQTCRWIGISVDAATSETYNLVKGIKGETFKKVCENVKKLTKRIEELGVLNEVGFKFLLSPYNYNEIYEAVRLAKSLGVKDFHLRPVSYLNITKLKGQELKYSPEMLNLIDKQIEKAGELETRNFRVYSIKHKFDPNLQPIKRFNKCWTIPMLPTFGADGNVHMCFDMRNRKDFIMCKHFEIREFWNSKKHKEMVNNIDINKCSRCTFSFYNEAVEQVFIEDKMCRNFL